MYLNDDVITILTEKLSFGQEDLIRLENDMDLAARCIGYLHLIRSQTTDRTLKLEALEKIQRIKEMFSENKAKEQLDVDRARAVFYSFRNGSKPSRSKIFR